jgi:cyclopropane-fatty-acyl-phospholipid synthase
MNSKLYAGYVEHERFYPTHHRLRYDLYVYALDLAELDNLENRLPLFGYNRAKPVSLHDGDYLDPQPGNIRSKLLQRLSPRFPEDAIGRVIMVTSPRLLGHVFNPVSFYFCFDKHDELAAAVAEVNNTFGEKHVYVLNDPIENGDGFPKKYRAEKAFHVSPFNTMGGTYEFSFSDVRRELDLQIDLHRDGEHILKARLQGQPKPLTALTHLKTLLRHPIMPHLTMSRIWKEAFKLRFKRKLDFFTKPVPTSPMTIRRLPPSRVQRYCMKLLLSHLAQTRHGCLRLTMPDGRHHQFGNAASELQAQVRVNDYRYFSRTVMGSDIGLGEAFMFDEWDTDDIPAVLRFFIRNRNTFKDGNFTESLLSRLQEKGRYLARANTLMGSRRNIQRHYDLSNAFFKTFLDDTMAYSCAVFNSPEERLEQAQRNKFSRIIEKARLGPDDHLLEIGCGWGGFAIEAVRRTGCRVTGITISEEQHRFARERVRQAGLEDRITILFRDYRKMSGRFDKIVSIEMLEAVGHAYFGEFFKQLDRLLAPEGIAVIQTISISDQRYDAYRRSHDWIQKHIFPGGLLPSLTTLTQAMTRHSGLMVDHLENIGNHYATTLARWHRRFDANIEQVAGLGFDRIFQRKWKYYLGSCEAAFSERVLGDLQMVLTREGNRQLGASPPLHPMP